MKVLLVQPPVRDFYDTVIRLQPLGLCVLKGAVKKYIPDVDVVVRDYHQGYGRRTVPYPDELSYLHSYYARPDTGPFSMFHQFYHFGATYNTIAADVKKEKPDMVGISSLFTPFYQDALACAKAIKNVLQVPIVLGGAHVSAEPLSVLTDPNVDFIIRGEGERPLVELLQVLRNNESLESVPNLGFKKDGKTILNPMDKPYGLTDLPWADLSDFSVRRYTYEDKALCSLTTTRGCSHQCSFCTVHLTFGNGCRHRGIDDIVMEIKSRYDHGYRAFDFEDDNLTFYTEHFKKILNRLKKEIPLRDIRLMAMNGISYISLDRETLDLMKQTGFKNLNISLISAKAETLLRVQRPHTLEKFFEVVHHGQDLGFDMVAYQILGLPCETREDMVQTMALLAKLPVLIGVSIFYRVPGSTMAEGFPEMTPEDMMKARSTAMAVETEQFKRDNLYTLFITARIINFIKGLKTETKRNHLFDVLDRNAKLSKKNEIGAEVLRRLFKEKVLYAVTKQGREPLSRFQTGLFFNAWEKMPRIIARNGSMVNVSITHG